MNYSEFAQLVEIKKLKIFPKLIKILGDGFAFESLNQPVSPEVVLRWDMFNLSLSLPMAGILTSKGKNYEAVTYQSLYLVKDGVVSADILKCTLEGVGNMDLSHEYIQYDELFSALPLDEYMSSTIKMLRARAEIKTINYYMSMHANLKCDSSPADEEILYLRSIGFDGKVLSQPKEKKHVESKLSVGVKSFSNLPPVPSVLTKIENNAKLTPSDVMIAENIGKYCMFSRDDLQKSLDETVNNDNDHKIATRNTNYAMLYKNYRFGRSEFINELICDHDGYSVTIKLK